MQQALFFMYGGVSDIGGAISLLDLITLADMYGVQGLSQVVAFLIKKENCHFFHKVCMYVYWHYPYKTLGNMVLLALYLCL